MDKLDSWLVQQLELGPLHLPSMASDRAWLVGSEAGGVGCQKRLEGNSDERNSPAGSKLVKVEQAPWLMRRHRYTRQLLWRRSWLCDECATQDTAHVRD